MQEPTFTARYFNQGEFEQVPREKLPGIFTGLTELVAHTDDMLRLHVTPERIQNIMSNDSGIEILFHDRVSVTSRQFGEFTVNKILVPFEGEFVGDKHSPVVTVFLGDNVYLTGPLRNSHGLAVLQEIMKVVKGQ